MKKNMILDFLYLLKKNNNKEWFHAHKSMYDEAKKEFVNIIQRLILDIGRFDKDVLFVAPADCIFRINRDIRFSHDKSPYKTNFGSFITKGGKNNGWAGYYFHIEPGECFLAGGIYMPQPDVLKAVRTDVLDYIDDFKKILSQSAFKKYFGMLDGEKLKVAPKGFPKEFPDIELLKFKYYTVSWNFPETRLSDPSFLKECVQVYKAMHPFNRFINESITFIRGN